MKKDIWSRMGGFFMGKGFYMVLLLCVTAIGASGYYLYGLATRAPAEEEAPVSSSLELEVEEPVQEEAAAMTEEEVAEALAEALQEAQTETERQEEAQTVILPEEKEAPQPAQEAEPAQKPVEEPKPDPASQPAGEEESREALFVPPVAGEAVAAFSDRELTYNAALGDWRTHNGVDLSAELGDPVSAAMDGQVLEVREDVLLGTTVTINHGEGLVSVYGNLSSDVAVSQGDMVKAGDPIGAVGQTAAGERNEGNWIHFELRKDGVSVDPDDYLAKSEAP